MIPDLLRYKKDQSYILFDLETECVNLAHLNLPWQAGYVVRRGDNIIKVVNDYIKWDNLNISPDAARITKFDIQKYESLAKPALQVLHDLEVYLNDEEYIVLTHNGNNFDFYLYQLWRKKLGLAPNWSFLKRSIDTNSLSKAYQLGIKTFNRVDGYSEGLKYTNYIQKGLKSSLGKMAKDLGVECDESNLHDAEFDTIINWGVWNKLKWLIEI